MQLPAVLVPYPAAADNHQFYNAKAFVDAGAALMLEQGTATGSQLAEAMTRLLQDKPDEMRRRLQLLHAPHAADLIAEKIILMMEARGPRRSSKQASQAARSPMHHSQAVAT